MKLEELGGYTAGRDRGSKMERRDRDGGADSSGRDTEEAACGWLLVPSPADGLMPNHECVCS